MRIRKRALPTGWYPATERAARSTIEGWRQDIGPVERNVVAGVIPHAGWEFSGSLAYEVLRGVQETTATVAIVGGHLPATGRILAAEEDQFETPFGPVSLDADMLGKLRERLRVEPDEIADNTVEIQLPLLRHAVPRAQVLYLRAPPDQTAVTLGVALAEAAESLGKRIAVFGSTDLTHYGPAYGFSPAGLGEDAARWVKDQNDRRFVDRVIAMDAEGAIAVATRERSACSAGGAAAAVSFARSTGATTVDLVGYRLSREIHLSESFVGYAGVTFRRPPGVS